MGIIFASIVVTLIGGLAGFQRTITGRFVSGIICVPLSLLAPVGIAWVLDLVHASTFSEQASNLFMAQIFAGIPFMLVPAGIGFAVGYVIGGFVWEDRTQRGLNSELGH